MHKYIYIYVYIYIYIYNLSCYSSISVPFGDMEHGDLSTLCHSCVFVCYQVVLKTFPVPGNLRSEDRVV